jgi:hypothetical protein
VLDFTGQLARANVTSTMPAEKDEFEIELQWMRLWWAKMRASKKGGTNGDLSVPGGQ